MSVSYQYLRQLKMAAKGLCTICEKAPLATKARCKNCAIKNRIRQRNKQRLAAGIPLDAPVKKTKPCMT